jgi:hypothetical protein
LDTALRVRGLDPWIDTAEIQPGDLWQDVIERGIAESTSMIVLCTSTPSSGGQRQDWERARQLGKRIVPVLQAGATLPEPLDRLHPIVFSGNLEDLADRLHDLSGDAIALGRPPPGLLDAMSKGELIPFIGAGLAADAGYPLWSEFVTRLLDWAERQKQLRPALLRSLQASVKAGDYNSVADGVAGVAEPSGLVRFIGETFDPSGRTLLATGGDDGAVRLWDPATGTLISDLASQSGTIRALATVPDSSGRTLLATGGDDGAVRLWDPATGTLISELASQSGTIRALATVPDSSGRNLLATGGSDGAVRLWDPATGTPVGEPLRGHTDAVFVLATVPGSSGRTLLATGGSDGAVRLWDPATGTPVGEPLTGHTDAVFALATVTNLGKELPPPPEAYRILSTLPVPAVVTTNFDRLVDQTWPDLPHLTWRDSRRVLDCLSLGERFTLHVYGHPDDAQSLLFSPAQLDELLSTNLEVARALEAVFSSRTMLFVGVSLSGISDFVQSLSIRSGIGPGHYAVAHADSPSWQAHAEQLRRRYNIEVLPYSGAAHKQVTTFLSRLSHDSGRPAKGALQGQGEKLARISLENIGPYKQLKLDLDPRWNVLLGDNGVGKSSILKAIALVYYADDESVYADRLLRVGTSRGSIRLETDAGRSFHTDLLRSTTGVQVRHTPGIRLEAEKQLVIGLPPLRSLSWRRESGLSGPETSRRPSPSDLLPLLADDPDPRLDSVKQRIINCDYLIKDALTKGTDASPYRRLLDDLAYAMEILTDGLAVRFGGVDAPNNIVFVETVDGRLPIEALSQGTGALIGWVSFIIQRLHDTAAEDEVPLERGAIVLVDELDAHLHPDWQQQLTSRLGKLFPRAQFVGTTHSPLIVSGMHQRQVTALTRQDGQVTKVQLPGDPGDVIRGRADQLLTGRLFGLTTSADNDTRRAVERYNALLGRDRTPAEDAEFHELQDLLEVRVPVGATTPAEQRAQDLLRLLLLESAGPDMSAERERLLERAALLLEEAARMRPDSE